MHAVKNTDYIEHRRREVARLIKRGIINRFEILDELTEMGLVNPMTGLAWSMGTIASDIDAIKATWRRESSTDVQDLVAGINAELDEVRRVAWKNMDLKLVLEALKQKRELLGVDQPKKIHIKEDVDINHRITVENIKRQALEELSDDELDALHTISERIQPALEAAQSALPGSIESPGDLAADAYSDEDSAIIDADFKPDSDSIGEVDSIGEHGSPMNDPKHSPKPNFGLDSSFENDDNE